jgi:hypothetical protein
MYYEGYQEAFRNIKGALDDKHIGMQSMKTRLDEFQHDNKGYFYA